MSSSLTDYKDWIQNKADEIAMGVYAAEFYNMSPSLQDEVYDLALEAYKDALASRIDLIYEALRDKQLGGN